MPRNGILLVCASLLLPLVADFARGQTAATDLHGDPLPDGAVARLGTVRWRHGALVAFAAFSADGKRVVSVSDDGFIRVWEYPAGKEIRRILASPVKDAVPGSVNPVAVLTAAALSPDGKTIATSFSSGASNVLIGAGLLPGGKDEDVKKDEQIRLHDLATGKEVASLKAHSPLIMALSFSPNGKLLTTRDGTGMVRIWDWAGAKEVAKIASRGVDAPRHGYDDYNVDDFLVASPDGKTLMFGGLSSVLRFADLQTGQPLHQTAGHLLSLKSIRFTPNGKHLLAQDSDWLAHKWDAATSKDLGPVKQPSKSRVPTIISPDGLIGVEVPVSAFGRLGGFPGIVGGPNPKAAKDPEVVFFDTTTGKERGKIALKAQNDTALFSPDSKILALCSGSESKIELYDVATTKLLRKIDSLPEVPVPKGRGIGGIGGPGGPGGPIFLGGRFGRTSSSTLFFSADGKTLAFWWNVSPVNVVLFDTGTGKEIGKLTLPEGSVPTSGVFSADGRCLAVDMQDGTVTLYELATGQARRSYGDKLPQDKGAQGRWVWRWDWTLYWCSGSPTWRTMASCSGCRAGRPQLRPGAGRQVPGLRRSRPRGSPV